MAKNDSKLVDTTKPGKLAVAKGEKKRYRVLRPILHGKIGLVEGDLVDMAPEDAAHLVATFALAPHVIAEQVSRVFDLPVTPKPAPDTETADAYEGAVSAEVTAVEATSEPVPNN